MDKKRARNILIVLHWLSAILIFSSFGVGLLSLVNHPNNGTKIVPLAVHIVLGILILFLTLVRYFVRLKVYPSWQKIFSARPTAGKKTLLLDELSKYVHPLLYVFVLLMIGLGLAIAFPADLFNVIFGVSGQPLPVDFYVFAARDWHGIISLILMLLIGQHVLTALFHQFVKGENFLGRMWFARERNKKGER